MAALTCSFSPSARAATEVSLGDCVGGGAGVGQVGGDYAAATGDEAGDHGPLGEADALVGAGEGDEGGGGGGRSGSNQKAEREEGAERDLWKQTSRAQRPAYFHSRSRRSNSRR